MAKGIRAISSRPALNDKILLDVADGANTVHWYIKFNIPLDERTVSGDTMDVTDTRGYTMRTDISYNPNSLMIAISPLDTYQDDTYYLLNISKRVRSAKGSGMSSELHILFKLEGDHISRYETIKSAIKVPKRRPRPRNYEAIAARPGRDPLVERVTGERAVRGYRNQLSHARIRINVWVSVIGLIAMIFAFYYRNVYFSALSALLCAAGAAHIVIQAASPGISSMIAYERGLSRLSKGDYAASAALFRRALERDPRNKLAGIALERAEKAAAKK